jgi:hypothetical protein
VCEVPLFQGSNSTCNLKMVTYIVLQEHHTMPTPKDAPPPPPPPPPLTRTCSPCLAPPVCCLACGAALRKPTKRPRQTGHSSSRSIHLQYNTSVHTPTIQHISISGTRIVCMRQWHTRYSRGSVIAYISHSPSPSSPTPPPPPSTCHLTLFHEAYLTISLLFL